MREEEQLSVRSPCATEKSSVTLLYGQLNSPERRPTFVDCDCGHGHAFVRCNTGTVEELFPRKLPLDPLSDDVTVLVTRCTL